MLQRSNILLTLLILWQLGLSAQERCGFEVVHKKNLRNSESYRKNVEAQEKFTTDFIQRSGMAQTNNQGPQLNQALAVSAAIYNIPVVVHVIHTGGAVGTIYNPSDADIQGAIAYLNQVYDGSYPGIQGVGDVQIQFALATRDVNCNPTTGIVRLNGSSLANYATNGVNVSATTGASEINVKNLSRWDPSTYYNIWMVNRIDGSDGTSGSYIAGFAYFPGSSSTMDGTVILATAMKTGRKTLPHEMGHAFDLYHVFEGSTSTCVTNANCATDGDKVCDTDPITSPSNTCRTGTNTCNGLPYSINTESNFMNYTSCYTLFTLGQKNRMLAAAAGPFRKSLSSSYALASLYPVTPYTPPASASCTPVTSATGMAGYYAGVMQLDLAGRTVISTTPADEGGYKNNGTDCHSLITLQQGSTYSMDVTLYGVNAEQMKGWLDFNNNGVFDNATEQIISFSESTIPSSRTTVKVTGNFAVPADAVTNTVIKLRIIDDIATLYGTTAIGSACQNPVYGQAEDYPIYIEPSFLLPLQMSRFVGRNMGSDNLLEWETASEQHTDRFVIQRSSNGTQFSDIASEKARGAENIKTAYRYTDKNVSAGSVYYRLKQYDKDEKFTYSQIVEVRANLNRSSSVRILNNPATTHLDLEFLLLRTLTTVRIIDITGNVQSQFTLPKGIQRHRIYEVNRLKPGVYLIQFNGDTREVLKFIKQ